MNDSHVSTPEPGGNHDVLEAGSFHETPFFADMTLDLSEAHDIAETPEAVSRKTYDPVMNVPPMPPLMELSQPASGRQEPPISRRTENPFHSPSTQSLSYTDPGNSKGVEIFPNESSRSDIGLSMGVLDLDQAHEMVDDEDGDSFHENDHNDLQVMGRVTSSHSLGGRFRPFGNANGKWRTRFRKKQWPKDISWAVAFWMIVPVLLLVPLIRFHSVKDDSENESETSWLAAATSPRSATLHTLFWGLLIAIIVMPRFLYRTSGGVGPGDDARHFASQLLLASAPISAMVYVGLFGGTYAFLPNAVWPYGLIPLWYLARDIYLFRRWKMTASTPGGRQAFFQALSCAALDILSRSLKRKPFYRTVVIVVAGQFGVIALWRLSLLAALRSGSLFWSILAFVGGKWATGTVARLLTLTACGGVSNWFAEQSSLLERMQEIEANRQKDEEVIEFTDIPKEKSDRRLSQNKIEDAMPEAYRMADASQYKPSVRIGRDGDFESDDDESFHDEDSDDGTDGHIKSFLSESALNATHNLSAQRRKRERHQRREQRNARSSTVHQLMISGLSTNFGSVAKCGLLGGLAQFVWSQIRKIDHARATFGGMQGMPVGQPTDDSSLSARQLITQMVNSMARNFVKGHSDMAMSYVADYQMSYTRAAREVALLVDEAGVEPILHDDISTHMSACVGGSVSGIIILFTGWVLVHQRDMYDPNVPDSAVALDMVIAFFFCYTLVFTVMEPLRASIKALYVCFAQHPEALSQAFPLIYHRLKRMSESNLHGP